MTRWEQPAPGEQEAGDRAWDVVSEAYAERIPAPRERDRRPLALVPVAAAIVLAAALSPPGHAILGSLRDAVRGEQNARPALFSLPVPKSRLLVNSAQGAWVVRSDGSKRLLAGYRAASWSPHGLYLAAISGDELRALEPDGKVHWSIGRAGIADPRWSNERTGDERIAYLARRTLRVIGGDGRGDHVLARNVTRVAAAWLPRTHVLAYVDGAGRIVVRDADSGAVQWRARAQQRPAALDWSSDGKYLLARGPNSLTVLSRTGDARIEPVGGPQAAPILDAAFMPSSHAIASIQRAAGRSVLWFYPQLRPDGTAARRVFAGAGTFDRVAWSPDARWLLLSWQSADQWLFIRSAAVRRVIPISGIDDAFGPAADLDGWCCP